MRKSSGNDSNAPAGRRDFLKATGAAAAGLYLARAGRAAAAKTETLAINGGKPAVSIPPGNTARWPLYGVDEERAVVELVRNPNYSPIAQLEREWQQRYQSPFVKAYCNGTGALTSMFFALNLPPGSEVMVPSYTFFATIVPMRLFGLVPVFVDIDPRTLNFDLEDAKQPPDEKHQGRSAGALDRTAGRHGSHLRLGPGKGSDRNGRRLPRPRGAAEGQADGHLGSKWPPSASR